MNMTYVEVTARRKHQSTNQSTNHTNGVRQELEIQMALRVKSGLIPVQWQCRFRTLVSIFIYFLYMLMFYLYLWMNKLLRKCAEFQLVIQ